MNVSDIVNLSDRAKTAISLGESHFREFKSALQGPPSAKVARDGRVIAKEAGEALVAFANADGGELIIGVEDSGSITGVDCISASGIDVILNAPKTHVHSKTPLPPVRTAIVELEGRKILYFSIQKSTTYIHLTSDGRYVQRRDLETVPIPAEEILFDRRERDSREYDREYVDGASAADLHRELLQTVADQISPGMSIEKCLQYLDLAEYIGPGLRLRRAALLLFANEPSKWHPRLQLRIIKVEGIELLTGSQYNAKSDNTVTGNILQLIVDGWEALRPQLVQTRLGKDARFGTTIMYPELACREALVNAIAHRDYSEEGRGIEIYVFDDRMEVRNPGALLSSISIEDLMRLEGIHQSRNSTTSRVLREVGYMRELGEGMRRMFELMSQNELTSPELASAANSFCVTLRHSTIYSPAQKLWLDQFDSHNLSREQKAIVALGLGGNTVAPQDIWESLGIVDTEHYRQLVKSLQVLGVLRSEISKAEAQKKARARRCSVRKIPRFRIVATTLETQSVSSASPTQQIRLASEELDGPQATAQLWVGNLSYSVSDESVVEFLSQIAVVEDLYIPRDRHTGRGKGYAFAEFESPDTADRVLNQINGQVFDGRKILARRALPRKPK